MKNHTWSKLHRYATRSICMQCGIERTFSLVGPLYHRQDGKRSLIKPECDRNSKFVKLDIDDEKKFIEQWSTHITSNNAIEKIPVTFKFKPVTLFETEGNYN